MVDIGTRCQAKWQIHLKINAKRKQEKVSSIWFQQVLFLHMQHCLQLVEVSVTGECKTVPTVNDSVSLTLFTIFAETFNAFQFTWLIFKPLIVINIWAIVCSFTFPVDFRESWKFLCKYQKWVNNYMNNNAENVSRVQRVKVNRKVVSYLKCKYHFGKSERWDVVIHLHF